MVRESELLIHQLKEKQRTFKWPEKLRNRALVSSMVNDFRESCNSHPILHCQTNLLPPYCNKKIRKRSWKGGKIWKKQTITTKENVIRHMKEDDSQQIAVRLFHKRREKGKFQISFHWIETRENHQQKTETSTGRKFIQGDNSSRKQSDICSNRNRFKVKTLRKTR